MEKFFKTGSKAGIHAAHAAKLQLQLTASNSAICPQDMNALSWRLTFRFDNGHAEVVDYQDYH